ncbi:hypothetical protein [Prosthecomicrobium sp. N25]|uniref:hypothetical protein n=1 Tax=Prosthecomicrobium sp. N25 TaxID=3129254 RepID=UPI003078A1A4
MQLVEILLPTADNEGQAFPAEAFARVRDELVARHGGVTAHLRAPAQGVWAGAHATVSEDVVVIEVMVGSLDRGWWSSYRTELERRFRQEAIVIRAHPIERL